MSFLPNYLNKFINCAIIIFIAVALTTFAEALKKMREELNLTQESLARELNISFAAVNKWENGRTKPLRIVRDRIVELSKEKGVSEDITNILETK